MIICQKLTKMKTKINVSSTAISNSLGNVKRRSEYWPSGIHQHTAQKSATYRLSTLLFCGLTIFVPNAASLAQTSIAPTECTYADKREGIITVNTGCLNIQHDRMFIHQRYLKNMTPDEHGLVTLHANGQFYHVNPTTGHYLAVIGSDNWADDYSLGLVRAYRDGKIAFYDRTVKQVIPPLYDFAWRFEKGYALVCIGCHTDNSPCQDADDGCPEHRAVIGGKWGYINQQGKEVVPVFFSCGTIWENRPKKSTKGIYS